MIKYPYYFKCPYCSKPAYWLSIKPLPKDRILSEYVYYDDGLQPTPYTKVLCQHCHQEIKNKDILIENIYKND